jgi:uncharacterized protein YkwD
MSVRAWLCLSAASLSGCRLLQPLPAGQFPVESIEVPEEATTYVSEPRPVATSGGAAIQRVQSQLVKSLGERGPRVAADGALAATACWALREAHRGNPIDTVGMEAASRHFGFGGVARGVLVLDTRSDASLGEQLESMPRNVTITRYGICASPSEQSAALAFGSVELSYAPIARAFELGESVSLKGRVDERFRSAHVYLTKPDGSVVDKPMRNRAFEVTFQLDAKGRYRLEVMGDGENGPEIASNLPLYVGVPEPPIAGVAGKVVTPEQTEARMLLLLNEARRAAGAAPLSSDPELREIALGHSTDMVEHHFFAHVSPTTGAPEDRLRRSGVVVADFGENISAAATPEEAHEGLMSSPGHRANMLRPGFTHVGIAARKSELGMAITLNFGRRPSATALPTSTEQVRAAIVARRKSQGLPAPSVDSVYSVGAEAAAEAWARGADEASSLKAMNSAQRREVARGKGGRPATCIYFLELLELDQLRHVPALAQAGVKRFGVGTRLKKDEKGKRLATVIVLEGATCQ